MEQQTLRYFRFFYKTFLRGLLGILPLTLSVYVVIWFFHSFGGFTDRVVSYVFPFLQGVPGMGLLVLCQFYKALESKRSAGFYLSDIFFYYSFDVDSRTKTSDIFLRG
jgi:hypothetical protein